MEWYLKALQNYVNFDGRARRREYWMFVLFNIIFLFCVVLADKICDLCFGYKDYGVFAVIYSLYVLIPSVAVGVRRLHDVGKSGLMILVGMIPIFGTIWLFIVLSTDGEPGKNEYGLNPKE